MRFDLVVIGAGVQTGTLPAEALRHTVLERFQTGGTLDHLLGAVFNHPTLSETERIAALDDLNRL